MPPNLCATLTPFMRWANRWANPSPLHLLANERSAILLRHIFHQSAMLSFRLNPPALRVPFRHLSPGSSMGTATKTTASLARTAARLSLCALVSFTGMAHAATGATTTATSASPAATHIAATASPAADSTPVAKLAPGATADATIKAAVEGTVAAIRKDPAAQGGDPARTAQLVRTYFIPFTDFARTARLAVGEAEWNKATPEQRSAVVAQFQTLLVRVYAAQLTQIQGQNVTFAFDKPTAVPKSNDVVIGSKVHTSTDDMSTRYRLAKTADGYKIYDIDLMGIWLVGVYKQQFADQLAKGGIVALINYLSAHNTQVSG